MKAKLSILIALLGLLLPYSVSASALPTKVYEKRLSETYPIEPDGRVKLENSYGEITVVTWNQPRVKIDVLIRVDARSEDDFQEVLERIEVAFRGGSNSVAAVTTVGNSNSGSWWKIITGGFTSSNDFKIYFTVNMPATVQLETSARYCDVTLPDLSGTIMLDVGYGDLVAGRLTGRNEIDISYGAARIEEIGTESTLKFRYSEGSVRRAGKLRYDGRYSEVRFGRVGDLTLQVGYDEIEVESAREVRLNGNYNDLSIDLAEAVYLEGNYTDFELGTITRVLEIDGNYGDVEVDDLRAGFERVNIRVSYSDVRIDVAPDAGYTLDLSARYGDIDVPREEISPRNSSSESSTDRFTGTKAGKGNGTIKIVTNYGDIEIY